MEMKPGTKLASTVCETEVIVVRPPTGDVEVACGGAPMVPAGSAADPTGSPDPDHADATALGKRYVHEGSGLELLCTRPGAGSLSVDGLALPLKEAKPLPSSD